MVSTRNQQESYNGNAFSGQEAFSAWADFYQKMAEESIDYYQKGFETFQKMSPITPGNNIYKEWMNNYQDFLSRVGEETGSGSTGPEASRRIYEAWMDIWSRNFESYMRTPEFIAKSGQDLGHFSDMQKKMGEFMEAYWHAVHLPTSDDMREIYHKLYTLDRKLDEMDRRMREFMEESRSAASAKKPKNNV